MKISAQSKNFQKLKYLVILFCGLWKWQTENKLYPSTCCCGNEFCAFPELRQENDCQQLYRLEFSNLLLISIGMTILNFSFYRAGKPTRQEDDFQGDGLIQLVKYFKNTYKPEYDYFNTEGALESSEQ